jgi:hypothetical protein
LPANPSATALYEVVTSTVNDVGHLQRRSVHALRDTPCPLNLAQRHQGWLNHTRMRPPLSKRLRSSHILSKFTGQLRSRVELGQMYGPPSECKGKVYG